jgi:TetR/AcrR family transcriptional regulator, transcriptional repressor for nem operon
MARTPRKGPARGDARKALLEAATRLVRVQGFAATSVDELCRAAGVTKGAFFHHFASKEALGVAVARHWSETTGALFATAPYHLLEDPVHRILAYIDFRKVLLQGEVPDFTCLVGTLVQEAYESSPAIRDACAASIFDHARTLEADIAEAIETRGIGGGWSAASLARHTQAVLQGAFILSKAQGDPAVAAEQCDHLRRYVTLLFESGAQQGGPGNAIRPQGEDVPVSRKGN